MFNKIYESIKSFIKNNKKFLITLLVLILINVVKLPYQVEMPGGTIDLSDRVIVNGKKADISGSFNMAYVSSADGSIPYILIGLVNKDWKVVKNSDLKYDNETMKDVNTRDTISLEQSKINAQIAALKASNTEFTITKEKLYVMSVAEDIESDLKVGDQILKIDDIEINNEQDFSNTIDSKQEGNIVKILVKRNKKEETIESKLYKENEKIRVGITIAILYDIECDKEIEITSKSSESGPSGGMMMSLMIYNGLTNQDLTHGKKIVGTGTISANGKVGEIGGVKYKIMGAAKSKADIFLIPKDNYEEAKKIVEEKKYKLTLVSLETLDDAINYLENL